MSRRRTRVKAFEDGALPSTSTIDNHIIIIIVLTCGLPAASETDHDANSLFSNKIIAIIAITSTIGKQESINQADIMTTMEWEPIHHRRHTMPNILPSTERHLNGSFSGGHDIIDSLSPQKRNKRLPPKKTKNSMVASPDVSDAE